MTNPFPWELIRRRPWATALVATAIALMGANVYLYKQRQEEAVTHEDARRRGEMMVAFLADRPRIESDLAALREAVLVLNDSAVREESKEVNLGYFYRVEKATRVRLTRIDQMVAEPAAPDVPYKSVPVTLQLSGSYRNLLAFIREVETGPRVMRVNEYQLERLHEGSDELGLSLTLDMLAHP